MSLGQRARRLLDLLAGAAFTKPAAGLYAFTLLSPLEELRGIAVWQPALTSVCCWVAALCCWSRGDVGRLLGWFWVLVACAWANRPIRDVWGAIPWWCEIEWLVIAPLALLLGAEELWKSKGSSWLWLAASPLAGLLGARGRALHVAGCATLLAIAASPLVFTDDSGISDAVELLVYGSCCAASVASAWMVKSMT